jgi:hypothetical protein
MLSTIVYFFLEQNQSITLFKIFNGKHSVFLDYVPPKNDIYWVSNF